MPILPGLCDYEGLYHPGSYAPPGGSLLAVARRVRELCAQSGLRDRIPPPVIPGDRRECNKRIAEWLADWAYALELEAAPPQRAWAYREAARAIEDLEQDIGLVYRSLGRRGLQSLPNIGPEMAHTIERRLIAEA